MDKARAMRWAKWTAQANGASSARSRCVALVGTLWRLEDVLLGDGTGRMRSGVPYVEDDLAL